MTKLGGMMLKNPVPAFKDVNYPSLKATGFLLPRSELAYPSDKYWLLLSTGLFQTQIQNVFGCVQVSVYDKAAG
ncbi:MAG: hypothetical protein ACREAW_05070, partial [Nitrososphaera sp.]